MLDSITTWHKTKEFRYWANIPNWECNSGTFLIFCSLISDIPCQYDSVALFNSLQFFYKAPIHNGSYVRLLVKTLTYFVKCQIGKFKMPKSKSYLSKEASKFHLDWTIYLERNIGDSGKENLPSNLVKPKQGSEWAAICRLAAVKEEKKHVIIH